MDDRLLELVQDHTRITDVIDAVCTAIENGTDMPHELPVLNDLRVTDQLGLICQTITTLRRALS